jgi:hypothetical protein
VIGSLSFAVMAKVSHPLQLTNVSALRCESITLLGAAELDVKRV